MREQLAFHGVCYLLLGDRGGSAALFTAAGGSMASMAGMQKGRLFQHMRDHCNEHTVDDDLLLVRAGRQQSGTSEKPVTFRIDRSRIDIFLLPTALMGRAKCAPTPAALAAVIIAAVRLRSYPHFTSGMG